MSSNGHLHIYCPWDGHPFSKSERQCPDCGALRGIAKFDGQNRNTRAIVEAGGKPVWRKILWEKQPFDDDYVDHTFLESLITNADFHEYDWWTLVKDSAVISQHFSTVTLFVVVFVYTYFGQLSCQLLFALDGVVLVAGYGAVLLTRDQDETSNSMLVAVQIKRCLLFVLALYTLSPILRTLTAPIADDTVWALSLLLLLLHLMFHDYSFVHGSDSPLGGAVSLNTAIFASVLLASRLPSNAHVMALLCHAVQLLALGPIMYRALKRFSLPGHLALTLALVLLTVAVLFLLSPGLGMGFVGCISTTTVLAPLWLLLIQDRKKLINGPWDEAVPSSVPTVPRVSHLKTGGGDGAGLHRAASSPNIHKSA